MTTDLEDLKIEEIAFVDKGAGKGVKVALFKRYNNEEETQKMKNLDEVLAGMSEEDAAVVLQAVEEAKAVEAEHLADEKPAEEESADKAEEEDEEMEKRFCVLKSENQAMRERIAKMEEDRERESFIKRAETMTNVPTFSTEELGDFLLQVNKCLAPEMAEKTEAFVKAVNNICSETSIMKELGTAGQGSTAAGSALQQAEAMAQAAMKADAKLTKAVALNHVWESNPELRNRYRMEKRGN